jgi:hypothetical protein
VLQCNLQYCRSGSVGLPHSFALQPFLSHHAITEQSYTALATSTPSVFDRAALTLLTSSALRYLITQRPRTIPTADK